MTAMQLAQIDAGALIATVGAVWIRMEHRMTKLEDKVDKISSDCLLCDFSEKQSLVAAIKQLKQKETNEPRSDS